MAPKVKLNRNRSFVSFLIMEVSAPPSATNNLLHHNLRDQLMSSAATTTTKTGPTKKSTTSSASSSTSSPIHEHHMTSKSSPVQLSPSSILNHHQLIQQQQQQHDVVDHATNRSSSPSVSSSIQQFNSRSNSSSSEIEKELAELELAGVKLNATVVLENGTKHHKSQQHKTTKNKQHRTTIGGTGNFHSNGNGDTSGPQSIDTMILNGTSGLSTSLTSSTTTGSSNSVTNTTPNTIATTGQGSTVGAAAAGTASLKKRISSSRTPTRKARRIRFLRNGDRFYGGITIPVSNERYRSFESLAEDLTRLLEENVKIPGAVRNIFTLAGKKISNLDELEDGQNYVCSCNNESFKKIEYNTTGNSDGNGFGGGIMSSASSTGVNTGGALAKNKQNNRLTKSYRPSSPLKNGGLNGSPILKVSERDSVVHPRIVTLIRNGTKPRKIMRLLLNKRNSPSFDHVLTAITQTVKLDSGCVRKMYTVSGVPVLQLADFFGAEDEFFAYGTERVNADDFKLEPDEIRMIRSTKKPLRNGSSVSGPKPKMPVKSKNVHNITYDCLEETLIDAGIQLHELPLEIRERYALGNKVGDGNFAVVLKVADKQTNETYALKIIDKSKCKGKEHYIDAEVRVMKKLHHPHIIDLILDVDRPDRMYLVLEYVGGGDLFDAITQVTRFSEDQSRVMIRHLASAMAYLHSMSIVHRDIKPENLLVEIDSRGNVVELKLADFGLACEVTEPLFAVCGTPTYVAPEILMETGYALKIDVWAAGIILYILLCGFPPFVSSDNQQEPLFDAILSGVYEFPDPYWSDIGEGVRDLISNMLQSDPDVRFSSEDILDHYWTLGENADYR